MIILEIYKQKLLLYNDILGKKKLLRLNLLKVFKKGV